MAGPIRIAILANGSQAKSELNSVAGTAQRMGNGFRSLRAPAAAALGAIAIGAKQAVDSASDLNEESSKSEQIFGRGAKAIDAFASTAATKLGQSKTQALAAASTFGIIGDKAGLSGRELTGFSTQFTGLASDLASFNNTSPEQAIEAIGAAMRGEAEPIRKYGVLLDDATLRNRALKLGLIDSVKTALTPQQKALAASQEILAQTGKAQGDFARTADGAANKQRILAAQVTNLKANIGQGLLPAFTGLVNIGTRVVGFLSQNQTVAKVLVGVLGALAVAILAVNAAMLLNPAVLIVAGIVALGAALVLAYQKCEPFRAVVQQLAAVFITNVLPVLRQVGAYITGTLIPIFLRTAQSVGQSLKPVLQQLAATFQQKILPTIKLIIAKFREWWPAIQRVITVVFSLMAGLIRFQATVLSKVLPVIIRLAGFIISNVVPAVLRFVSAVISIISRLVAFGAALARGVAAVARFATAVAQKIAEIIRYFAQLPGKIIGALGDLGSQLYSYAKAAAAKLGQGLVDGIRSAAGAVKGAASDVVGNIKGLLPGSPIKEGPLKSWNRGGAGKRLMGFLIDGIRATGPNVVKEVAGVTAKIKKLLDDKKITAGMAKQMQQVAKDLGAQAEKIATTVKAKFDLGKSLTDSFRGEFDLKSLIRSDEDTAVFGPATFDVAKAKITGFVTRVRAFAGKLRAMQKAGLPGALIAEVAGLGSTDGSKVADTLLSGGSSGASYLRNAYASIDAASSYAANIAAGARYGRQIQAQQAALAKSLTKAGGRRNTPTRERLDPKASRYDSPQAARQLTELQEQKRLLNQLVGSSRRQEAAAASTPRRIGREVGVAVGQELNKGAVAGRRGYTP